MHSDWKVLCYTVAGIRAGYRCVSKAGERPQILFESNLTSNGIYRGSLEETREARRTMLFGYVQRKLDRPLELRERLIIARAFRENGRYGLIRNMVNPSSNWDSLNEDAGELVFSLWYFYLPVASNPLTYSLRAWPTVSFNPDIDWSASSL